jgi:hypothetical protein
MPVKIFPWDRLVYMDDMVVAVGHNQELLSMGSVSLLFIKERLEDPLLEWIWTLECFDLELKGYFTHIEGIKNRHECKILLIQLTNFFQRI